MSHGEACRGRGTTGGAFGRAVRNGVRRARAGLEAREGRRDGRHVSKAWAFFLFFSHVFVASCMFCVDTPENFCFRSLISVRRWVVVVSEGVVVAF